MGLEEGPPIAIVGGDITGLTAAYELTKRGDVEAPLSEAPSRPGRGLGEGSRIAIVGGGITGLTAAYELAKRGDVEVHLFEASDRLGGKIRTQIAGDFLIEQGPDAFFTRKSGVMELVEELVLQGELIEPLPSEFAMLVQGELHRVPRGLVTLGNVDPQSIRDADFLTAEARQQALTPRTPKVARDISIRDFFTARYGPEFSRLVAEPLLAGTHGGSPDRLSMRALYPAYLTPPPPAPTTGQGPTFRSFRGGMETLTRALAQAIQAKVKIHLETPIDDLSGIDADHTILAVPARSAARIVQSQWPVLADKLREIPHRSATIATFAFAKNDVRADLPYTGFLVPEGEHPTLTGSTWSSAKWTGRAPEGMVLIRAFVHEETTEESALAAIGEILRIEGSPLLTKTFRYMNAQPQYELGHLEKVEEIDRLASEHGHLTLTGTSYRGVGIPDCIRQGRDAARALKSE